MVGRRGAILLLVALLLVTPSMAVLGKPPGKQFLTTAQTTAVYCGGSSTQNPMCATGHAAYVFDGYMYLTAGWWYYLAWGAVNSSWRSADGVTWTQLTLTATYQPRAYPAHAVFDSKMWMMGGYNETPLINNETWYSTNAITWTNVNSSSAWTERSMASAVTYDGKLWLYGGSNLLGETFSDLWFLTTANETAGVWTQAKKNALGLGYGRAGACMYVLNGEMWITGGDTESGYLGDSWHSTDGLTWTQAVVSDDKIRKEGAACSVTSDGYAVMAAGFTSGAAPSSTVSYTSDGNTWFWANQTGANIIPALYGSLLNYTPVEQTSVPWTGYEAFYFMGAPYTGTNFQGKTAVTLQPPNASATQASAGGSVPASVVWTDTSTGYRTGWAWDFKDGYLSYIQNASHIFSASGTFPVTFTPDSPFGSSTWTGEVVVSTQQQQVIYYTQKQVTLHIVDAYGVPISGANVTASYLASQLPSTDISWLVAAFGITNTVAGEMLNGSIAMQGWTGSNGATTFTMFPSLTYGLTIQNTTTGLNNYRTLAPAEADYTIYCPIPGQRAASSFTSQLGNTTLWYQIPDQYHMQFCGGYRDSSGYTTNLVFSIWRWANMTSMVGLPLRVYTYDFGPVSSSDYVQDCNWTVQIVNGDEYKWQWNISRSQAV